MIREGKALRVVKLKIIKDIYIYMKFGQILG